MVKKGDTLIEVTLAVGIFSMVAIAIVAVMSSGVSEAQTSLETTLAREEIDTQAEALRFIHSAYISDKTIENSPYVALWDKITSNAATVSSNKEQANALLQFTPKSCQELYDSNAYYINNAFVINPRMLGSLTSDDKTTIDINKVYVSAATSKLFSQAITYPHLVYGETSLVNDKEYNDLFKVEGIYVIAVADSSTTTIVGEGSTKPSKKSAFYDFYIRTCWYGSNAKEPSTISTVIRLYDPSVVTE